MQQTENGEQWTDPATGTTYVSQFTHLIVVDLSEQLNSRGASLATINIFGKGWNDMVNEESAFVGQQRKIKIGEYFVDLTSVAEEKDGKLTGPRGRVGPGYLWAFPGFQFVPYQIGTRFPRAAWGSMRAYLSKAHWDNNGLPYYAGDENRPWYIHGHGRSFPPDNNDNTDGCVGTKRETSLRWMAQVVRGTIPAYKIIPVTVHQQR